MTTPPARHSMRAPIVPLDRRDPGDDFLQQEIESNRRAEGWLVLKAFIALGLVAALVVVRQVFFA
ncbi:MAG: hypothetical protein ABJB03_09535 [Rhodoglobus sp.]